MSKYAYISKIIRYKYNKEPHKNSCKKRFFIFYVLDFVTIFLSTGGKKKREEKSRIIFYMEC